MTTTYILRIGITSFTCTFTATLSTTKPGQIKITKGPKGPMTHQKICRTTVLKKVKFL